MQSQKKTKGQKNFKAKTKPLSQKKIISDDLSFWNKFTTRKLI